MINCGTLDDSMAHVRSYKKLGCLCIDAWHPWALDPGCITLVELTPGDQRFQWYDTRISY